MASIETSRIRLESALDPPSGVVGVIGWCTGRGPPPCLCRRRAGGLVGVSTAVWCSDQEPAFAGLSVSIGDTGFEPATARPPARAVFPRFGGHGVLTGASGPDLDRP